MVCNQCAHMPGLFVSSWGEGRTFCSCVLTQDHIFRLAYLFFVREQEGTVCMLNNAEDGPPYVFAQPSQDFAKLKVVPYKISKRLFL